MTSSKKPRPAETVNADRPGSTPSAGDVSSVAEDQRNTDASEAARQRWWAQTFFQGWLSIAVWMTFGVLLEGLLAFKTPTYIQDEQRRELFRLAHTHGTFLGLVLVAAALCGQRLRFSPPRIAVLAFRIGATAMPVGFLLAGIWHYESDPGLAIWLVPTAALLLVFASVAFALASRANLRRDN